MSDINNFLDFIKSNEASFKTRNGNCKGCILKGKCKELNKRNLINSILEPLPEETRHPFLKKYLIDKFPFLLNIIPFSVYQSYYHLLEFIDCPYRCDLFFGNEEKIRSCYNMLSDDLSKKTFINLLMFRVTLNHKYIKEVLIKEPDYFIDGFCNLPASEFFVDCGAFDGDTFRKYLACNKTPDKSIGGGYLMFEPDVCAAKKIKTFIQENDYEEIAEVRPFGLSDENKVLKFCNKNGEGSTFKSDVTDKKNIKELEVRCLDKEINHKVSFIKMDIEGSEKEALKGCKKILETNYPKLAICVYHYITDMWDIPLYLKSIYGGNAKYLMRHHCKDNAFSTILYVKK